MRTRPCWLILAILLVSIPTTARADDHRADFDAGFGGANGSSIWGVRFGGALTFPKDELRSLAVVADGSFLWGSENEEDVQAGFVGLRFSKSFPSSKRHVVFLQALVGGNRTTANESSSGSEASSKGRAGMVGVGLDFIPDRHTHEKDGKVGGGNAIRIQVDLMVRNGDRRLIRVSIGFVHRLDK